jgi:hypothetical protein
VEDDLEALKARFEMFFLGIERREPARERDEMKRRVAKLKGEFVRNTALKFRIQTLNARFLSYERMWLRAAREKEEGVYRRDLMRARRRVQAEAAREAAKAKARETFSGPKPAELAGPAPPGAAAVPAGPAASAPGAAAKAAAPAPSSPPAAAAKEAPRAASGAGAAAAPRPPPAAPALPSGVSEAQVRELLRAYVEAKQRCHEDVSKVTYEALARTVAKQVPELMTKFGARSVEFKVVVKDGKALLKAVPKT